MEKNNFDSLVKAVTKKLVTELKMKNGLRINNKSCLILIPNRSFGIKEYLDYIIMNYPKYDIFLGTDEEFSEMEEIKNNRNIDFIKFDVKNNDFINIVDAVEDVIILGLKINQMKALIDINDKEDVNQIILDRLMANKSINIMINSNGLIFNKITDIVYNLNKMGINVINIQQKDISNIEKVDLITERYVVELKEKGLRSLLLDKKQLITPLAKDKLRELKIDIEFKEEDK